MKKILLLTLSAILVTWSVNAQYYSLSKLYHPGNPDGLNANADFDASTGAPPTGSTVLINYATAKRYTLQYSAKQTIPFTFNFNGGPVTQYMVSTSGYVTFSKKTTVPTGPSNTALPTATLPDSTICVWGLAGAGLGGQVYTKVYGTAPNRQLWIGYWFAGNPTDTNSQNMWAIVLEETTNNIYVVDQWGIGNTTSPTGVYNPINLTIGVQVNSTTAYQIAGSPNINSQTADPGSADNDYYEFIPGTQPSYDASVIQSNINNSWYYGVGTPYTITANVANFGATTLTSFNLNWSINSGTAQVDNVTGASVASSPAVQYDSVTHTIKWIPAAVGSYTLKLWADQLNGSNMDQNHSNDTLTISNIQVIDTVVNKVPLFEEFNQASCDPCAQATPNLDSVLFNNRLTCNAVRYHVSWPGQDFMNQETNGPFVSARVSYYGVTGVPDAKLDGSLDVYPGTMSTAQISNEARKGSPFMINITNSAYNPNTDTYSLIANIKSYANMPTGLVAMCALTIDTITYAQNQSTETIPQTVFPQVAEDLLPGSGGTALAAFTVGQTQTINVSWKKNHPWGANRTTWAYDSVGFHMTVFVQNKTSKYIYQSATVIPILSGINNISNNAGSMQVFPNPFNNETHLVYDLKHAQNVTVEVWNMLGQKVMDMNGGKQTEGSHEMTINKGNLQAGIYFLRLITDQGTAVQKIEIQ